MREGLRGCAAEVEEEAFGRVVWWGQETRAELVVVSAGSKGPGLTVEFLDGCEDLLVLRTMPDSRPGNRVRR